MNLWPSGLHWEQQHRSSHSFRLLALSWASPKAHFVSPSPANSPQPSAATRSVQDSIAPEHSCPRDSTSADDASQRKSRNEAKGKAQRAVKWGMELAMFNNSRIKGVLKVTSLDEDVFDALMLVKRLGPDVREGKRWQFNYIGTAKTCLASTISPAKLRWKKKVVQKTIPC